MGAGRKVTLGLPCPRPGRRNPNEDSVRIPVRRCPSGTPSSPFSPFSPSSRCSPRPLRRRGRSTGGSDRASRLRSSERTGRSFAAYRTAGTPSSSATARASTTSISSGRASTGGRASLSPVAAGGRSGCAPGPIGTGATLTGRRCGEGSRRSKRRRCRCAAANRLQTPAGRGFTRTTPPTPRHESVRRILLGRAVS
jgi:hypothetical protein